MAKEFFNQLQNLPKFPFGPQGKKDGSENILPLSVASGGYRPRKQKQTVIEPSMSMSLMNRGLLNPTGENNCFLNSTVQILWHIDVFRRSFRKIKGHTCVEEGCIFCALKELFDGFQHGGQSAIPPDVLRRAMAECYEEQNRFQIGRMDDAAECFEKILEQIHLHLTGTEDMESCGVKHCLSHQKFALTILERTECVCGATSEPLSFVQFIHYISSSAIVQEAQRFAESNRAAHGHKTTHNSQTSPTRHPGVDSSTAAQSNPVLGGGGGPRLLSASQAHFGKILNKASAYGEYRKCSEYDSCKNSVSVKRILLSCPDVVCLGMIWDSNQPSVNEIMSVVDSIGLTLQLNDLFDRVFADSASFNQYELTALIAYYGRHYSTFCYHSKMHEWIYFDDARFRTVGTEWSDVCEEIRKAHYQPLLLVYTNPFGEAIDLSEAPTMVTKICHRDNTETSTSSGSDAISRQPVAPPPSSSSDGSAWAGKTSTVTEGAEPSPSAATHTIDNMAFSLRPLLHAVHAQPTKSLYPILGDNQARAMPTLKGAMPTSALQQAKVNGTEDDLMSFSLTPAMLGKVVGHTVNPAGYGSVHHLESCPDPGGEGGDLIEFSLTPALLSKFKSSAVYSSGARNRLLDDQKKSRSPSLSPSRQQFQTSHFPGHQSPHSIPSSSSSPSPALPQIHSNTRSTSPQPLSHTTTILDHSRFIPNWEHFSESTSNMLPVVVAPQKLLPPKQHVPKVGVVTASSHGRDNQRSVRSKEEVMSDWTLITAMDPSAGDLKDCTPAVRQLRRVASQPGFDDVGVVFIPMKTELSGADGRVELAISRVSTESVGVRDLRSSSTSPTMVTSRRKFGPLPTPGGSGAMHGHQLGGKKRPAGSAGRRDDASSHSKQQQMLDYADLEYDSPGYEQVVERSRGGGGTKLEGHDGQVWHSAGSADYAEIRFQSPGMEIGEIGRMTDAGYSRLVDINTDMKKMEKNSAMPLGYDPDYAVPDQVALRLQRDRLIREGVIMDVASSKSHQSQAVNLQDRSRSSGAKIGDGRPSLAHAGTPDASITDLLPVSVREKFLKAKDLQAVGQASWEGDGTVAMMLFQQASSLLLQVMQDPVVRASDSIYHKVKGHRDAATRDLLLLQKGNGECESCKRCGLQRYLDNMLCGPCQLREKMNI